LFQLATQGNASSSAEIGELYVTYSFTMIRPKQQTPSGQNILASHYTGAVETTANAFVGSTQVSGSNVNMTAASNVITFKQLGRYNVNYVATSTTVTVGGLTFGAGVTAVNAGGAVGTGGVAGSGTASTSILLIVDVISLTAATITYNNTVVGGLLWDLFVQQVPSGLSLVDVSQEDKILDDRIQILERKLAKFAAFFEDRRDMLVEDYVEQKEPGVVPSSTVYSMPIGTPVLSRTVRNWM